MPHKALHDLCDGVIKSLSAPNVGIHQHSLTLALVHSYELIATFIEADKLGSYQAADSVAFFL